MLRCFVPVRPIDKSTTSNHSCRGVMDKLPVDTRGFMRSFYQGGSNQDKEQTQVLWKHRIMFSALICLFSGPLLLHCLNYLKWIIQSSCKGALETVLSQGNGLSNPEGLHTQLCNQRSPVSCQVLVQNSWIPNVCCDVNSHQFLISKDKQT